MTEKAETVLSNVVKSDWSAWVDTQPGVGNTSRLHVKGVVDVGNESDDYTLEFDYLDKSLPANLTLKMVWRAMLIPRASGNTKVELHYSCESKLGYIGEISVVYPDGSQVQISEIGLTT